MAGAVWKTLVSLSCPDKPHVWAGEALWITMASWRKHWPSLKPASSPRVPLPAAHLGHFLSSLAPALTWFMWVLPLGSAPGERVGATAWLSPWIEGVGAMARLGPTERVGAMARLGPRREGVGVMARLSPTERRWVLWLGPWREGGCYHSVQPPERGLCWRVRARSFKGGDSNNSSERR